MATNYTAKTQAKNAVQKQCSETLSFCPAQKSGENNGRCCWVDKQLTIPCLGSEWCWQVIFFRVGT